MNYSACLQSKNKYFVNNNAYQILDFAENSMLFLIQIELLFCLNKGRK